MSATDGSSLGCVTNFAPTGRELQIGVPFGGDWDVILNTNSGHYHDSGEPQGFRLTAVEASDPQAEHPASVTLTVPPLTTMWLRPA